MANPPRGRTGLYAHWRTGPGPGASADCCKSRLRRRGTPRALHVRPPAVIVGKRSVIPKSLAHQLYAKLTAWKSAGDAHAHFDGFRDLKDQIGSLNR